jgi:flagellar biosynthesis protein FlhF
VGDVADAAGAEANAADPMPSSPGVSPIAAARSRLAAARAAREAAGPGADPLAGRDVPVLREALSEPRREGAGQPLAAAAPILLSGVAAPLPLPPAATRAEQEAMMGELRSMRGLIEQRFGALAFMEKLQRHPRQAHLSQRLLDAGFSPALIRQLVHKLPADLEEATWSAGVLERNLLTAEREPALEDAGGVYFRDEGDCVVCIFSDYFHLEATDATGVAPSPAEI